MRKRSHHSFSVKLIWIALWGTILYLYSFIMPPRIWIITAMMMMMMMTMKYNRWALSHSPPIQPSIHSTLTYLCVALTALSPSSVHGPASVSPRAHLPIVIDEYLSLWGPSNVKSNSLVLDTRTMMMDSGCTKPSSPCCKALILPFASPILRETLMMSGASARAASPRW